MRPSREKSGSKSSESSNVARTTAEVLSDRTILELVCTQGKAKFLVWHNGESRFSAQFASGGTVYEPTLLDASTLSAIRFPEGVARYGSVGKLFEAILEALTRFSGIRKPELRAVPYWILASWFPELLPVLPTLVVASPSPADARTFLRLLRCFCRRGVLLTEVTPGGLVALPMELRPTILVEQARVGPRTLGLLRTATAGTYVSKGGRFLDLRCAKAMHCERSDLEAELREGVLKVSLFPAATEVSALDKEKEAKLASTFQKRLLRYRCENFWAVSKCTFDAPSFTTGVRDLARSLGASVVGDPALAEGIISLLSAEDDDVRAGWNTLPDVAIIVSLLAFVHEKRSARMPVSLLTAFVNAALRASGEIKEFNPIEIGRILSRLMVPRTRRTGGMAVEATREVSRRVHELQRQYGVTTTPTSFPGCPDCDPVEAASSKQLV